MRDATYFCIEFSFAAIGSSSPTCGQCWMKISYVLRPSSSGVAVLDHQLVHELAERLVEERHEPAAVLEPAVSVLVRPARGLHDPVEP